MTTNTTATSVDTSIKTLEGGIVTAAESIAIAAYPWLGVPIVKQIWEFFFGIAADSFEKAAATGATFAIIDEQTGTEVSGVSTALAALIAAEKSGDANAIKIAIQNYANANSKLVNSDGSATIQ